MTVAEQLQYLMPLLMVHFFAGHDAIHSINSINSRHQNSATNNSERGTAYHRHDALPDVPGAFVQGATDLVYSNLAESKLRRAHEKHHNEPPDSCHGDNEAAHSTRKKDTW